MAPHFLAVRESFLPQVMQGLKQLGAAQAVPWRRSNGIDVPWVRVQVEDLEAAVDHLRTEGLCNKVGLWGRSMGAVTA